MSNLFQESIALSTGISVPSMYELHNTQAINVILGHGLGSSNPKARNHLSDRWIKLVKDSLIPSGTNVLMYTARGHGESSGWEETAEDNPDQFTWSYLAKDMQAAAEYYTIKTFIAGGSSMGSATALYTAIENPDKVLGIIMIRPPTAWEVRAERRKFLLSSAEKLRVKMELAEDDSARKVHYVLSGTAYSDLPPPGSEQYLRIARIPVLILTIEGDPAHPLSTAETLHQLLPQSLLYIAKNNEQAATTWPGIIREFYENISKQSEVAAVQS